MSILTTATNRFARLFSFVPLLFAEYMMIKPNSIANNPALPVSIFPVTNVVLKSTVPVADTPVYNMKTPENTTSIPDINVIVFRIS